jgi:hypothetical protein
MDLSAHPWGLDGGRFDRPTPEHGSPSERAAFYALHNRRYGPSEAPPSPVVSFPGFEHPVFQSALEVIAQENGYWFANQGLGVATGREASMEEVFDAQAWSGRERILAESKRLFDLDAPPAPAPPTAPLPPTPAAPYNLPALSPLDIRVEELRLLLRQSASIWPGTARMMLEEALDLPAWRASRLFAREALHLYRLIRQRAGDPRRLP